MSYLELPPAWAQLGRFGSLVANRSLPADVPGEEGWYVDRRAVLVMDGMKTFDCGASNRCYLGPVLLGWKKPWEH